MQEIEAFPEKKIDARAAKSIQRVVDGDEWPGREINSGTETRSGELHELTADG